MSLLTRFNNFQDKHRGKLFWIFLMLALSNIWFGFVVHDLPNSKDIQQFFFFSALMCFLSAWIHYTIMGMKRPSQSPPE